MNISKILFSTFPFELDLFLSTSQSVTHIALLQVIEIFLFREGFIQVINGQFIQKYKDIFWGVYQIETFPYPFKSNYSLLCYLTTPLTAHSTPHQPSPHTADLQASSLILLPLPLPLPLPTI